MLYLLKQRNFGLLWTGGLISFTGDWILFVALPLYILQLTDSVLAMGIGFLVNLLPMLFLGSLGGVFADRWDRRKVLIWSNVALAPLYSILLLVDSADRVWIAYVAMFLGNLTRQLLNPAESALLPKLVGEEHLVAANALNSLNNNLARLIGPAVGGVAFATLGFSASVLLDVATFLVAAALIALISAPPDVTRATHEPDENGNPRKKDLRAEWLEGIKVVRERPILAALLILVGIVNLADGVITVLFAPYVKDALGGGSQELGWLLTSQAVGGLVGGAVVGRLGKRFTPAQLIAFGLLVFGVGDVFVFGIPVLWSNLILVAFIGIPIVALDVAAMTLFQRNTEDRLRGRVMGLYFSLVAFCLLIGRGIATFAGDSVGAVPLMVSVSVLIALCGLAAFKMLREPDAERAPAQPQPQPQPNLGG
jgi:MFS family permease